MERKYTPFQENYALSWANAMFTAWLAKNPDEKIDERVKVFDELVQAGLFSATQFIKPN